MDRLSLLILSLCAVLPSVFSVAPSCALLPDVTIPAGNTKADFDEYLGSGDDSEVLCEENVALAQYDQNGPLVWTSPAFSCDSTSNKLVLHPGSEDTRMPLAVSCVQLPANFPETCMAILQSDAGRAMVHAESPRNRLCPTTKVMQLSDGTYFKNFTCGVWEALPTGGDSKNTYTLDLLNDTNIDVNVFYNGSPQFIVKCVDPPTTSTTTTVATTTTKMPDSPATAAHLWNVNYYYNYGYGVHAFCADQACINAIQSNGIGYDMNNGKGLMGRAVSESAINAVRAACPTGSQNLRNLGFTKYGNKYGHNLNGSGIKQGWVSISRGACGATVGIKRWKSRYTDDMMYGVDLEWNTWYQGMVQEGGQIHFYMWN